MTQRFGLSPAEQQLFDVGLAQDEQAAFGVRPSAYAQLRQQQQPAPAPRKIAPPRSRPITPMPRVAPPRGIASAIPGAVEAFEEEAKLRKRNQALRRAFSVIPGGPEALAAIDGLVEGSLGSSRRSRPLTRSLGPAPAATMLKTVQREVDRALSAKDPRERKSLIEETVRKLPMGEEAFQSFSRERELTERNNRVRSGIGLPRTAVSPSSTALSADAEARLWDETLAHEETLGGNRPSTYARLRDEQRVWNDGLSQDGRAAAPRTTRVTPRSAAEEDRDFIEAEKEQARLHERNQARRRAYGAIEGGDEALARVDAIVAASRAPLPAAGGGVGGGVSSVLPPEVEEQLFAGTFTNEEPVPALAEARRILAAETAAEREALTMEMASKIPGGVESVLSFRAEAEQAERNAARRREMLADPGGLAALEAEDAYVEAAQRGLQYVVPEYGPQAPRLSAADRERLEALRPRLSEAEEELFRATLIDDVAAADPADVRYDLLDQLNDMFAAVTTNRFETSSMTLRAFSDVGANGRTAEERFREIADLLGFSPEATDQLLLGTPVSEVSAPHPNRSGVEGAFDLLQVREQDQVGGVYGWGFDCLAKSLGTGKAREFVTSGKIKGVSPWTIVTALSACAGRAAAEPIFDVSPPLQEPNVFTEQVPLIPIRVSDAFGEGGMLDPHTDGGHWYLQAFFGEGADGRTPDDRITSAMDALAFGSDQIARVVVDGRHASQAGAPDRDVLDAATAWDFIRAGELLTPPGMAMVDPHYALSVLTDPEIRRRAEAELRALEP